MRRARQDAAGRHWPVRSRATAARGQRRAPRRRLGRVPGGIAGAARGGAGGHARAIAWGSVPGDPPHRARGSDGASSRAGDQARWAAEDEPARVPRAHGFCNASTEHGPLRFVEISPPTYSRPGGLGGPRAEGPLSRASRARRQSTSVAGPRVALLLLQPWRQRWCRECERTAARVRLECVVLRADREMASHSGHVVGQGCRLRWCLGSSSAPRGRAVNRRIDRAQPTGVPSDRV